MFQECSKQKKLNRRQHLESSDDLMGFLWRMDHQFKGPRVVLDPGANAQRQEKTGSHTRENRQRKLTIKN